MKSNRLTTSADRRFHPKIWQALSDVKAMMPHDRSRRLDALNPRYLDRTDTPGPMRAPVELQGADLIFWRESLTLPPQELRQHIAHRLALVSAPISAGYSFKSVTLPQRPAVAHLKAVLADIEADAWLDLEGSLRREIAALEAAARAR